MAFLQIDDGDPASVVATARRHLTLCGVPDAMLPNDLQTLAARLAWLAADGWVVVLDEYQYFAKKSLFPFNSMLQFEVDRFRLGEHEAQGGMVLLGSIHTEVMALLEDRRCARGRSVPMTHALQRIHITGFGSLRDVTVEPGRLTVLIGANGSGKSNLLRTLRMVPLMHTGSLQRFVAESGGASSLLHYGPKRTQTIEVALDFAQGDRRNRYAAHLGFASGDKLTYLDETLGHAPTPDAALRETSLGAGHGSRSCATPPRRATPPPGRSTSGSRSSPSTTSTTPR